MQTIPKILAIIPARGGSKGILNKNIKPLLGKPLIAYSIEEAHKSKYIDRTVVSTDDEQIKKVAQDFKAEVIDRPEELAQDTIPINLALTHAVNFLEKKEGYKPDVVLLLQPTCPLKEAKHIDEAIEKFISGNYDSLVSMIFVYKHRYEINGEYLVPVKKDRLRRQERKPAILENGVIYLSTIDLIKQEKIIAGKIGFYKMDYESSVNIDDPIDFFIAKQLLINKQKYE